MKKGEKMKKLIKIIVALCIILGVTKKCEVEVK